MSRGVVRRFMPVVLLAMLFVVVAPAFAPGDAAHAAPGHSSAPGFSAGGVSAPAATQAVGGHAQPSWFLGKFLKKLALALMIVWFLPWDDNLRFPIPPQI